MTEASEPTVVRADIEADAARCWPAMRELRPHLDTCEEFLRRWRQQHTEGYRLVFIESGGTYILDDAPKSKDPLLRDRPFP